MQFQNFAFLGVAAGAIFACWNSVKDIALKFISLFIQTVDLVGDDQTAAFVGWMVENYKYSKVFNKIFESDHLYLNKYKKYGYISYLNMKKADMIFFNGLWPIIFKVKVEKEDKRDQPTSNKGITNKIASVYFVRNTFDVETVLGEAVQSLNEKTWYMWEKNKLKRFRITYCPDRQEGSLASGSTSSVSLGSYCKLLKHNLDDIGFVCEKKDQLATLFFPQEIKSKIELAKKWLYNKNWYEERNIGWKVGWILHGAPGCGKSSLVRAIGVDLDLPIYVYRLSELTAQQFTDDWKKMQGSTPCIALFEDIDAVFDKRENISGLKEVLKAYVGVSKVENMIDGRITTELTFDTFLNVLDGVEKYEGIFIILTTNDLSKIDPALYDRPGRISKVIELGYMSYECKLEMVRAILGENEELFNEMVEYVENNKDEKLTGAQFQEKCITRALNDFMREGI